MGGSVNLAARLMGKAESGEILVNESVYQSSQRDFMFNTLPPVQAKGYIDPVPVFEPISRHVQSDMKDNHLTKFIGRESELKFLKEQVDIFMKDCIENNTTVHNIRGNTYFKASSVPPIGIYFLIKLSMYKFNMLC